MKNFIVLVLMIGGAPSLNAQEVLIGAHGAFPIGAFSSDDLSDGGFAKTGYGINLESYSRFGSWPEKLHLAVLFSYQVNEVDGSSVGNAFNQELPAGNTASVSLTKYRPLTLMAGPMYRYQLSENLSLDFKISAGMMISNVDPLNVRIFDDQQNLIANEEFVFSSKPVFSYGLGINGGYDFNERFGIKLYVNYASAKEKLTGGGIEGDQRIAYFNTGLGLSIKFD